MTIFDEILLSKDDVEPSQWPKLICSTAEELEINSTVKATAFQGNYIAATTLNITGSVSFGDTDDDEVKITGVLRSRHSSGALLVDDALHATDSLTVDGNVGIGTTDPDTLLHMESDNADQGLKIGAKNKNTKIYLHIADKDYGFLALGGETKLRGNGQSSTFSGNLQIVRDEWTYLDIRCSKAGEDAVIRLLDGVKGSDSEHYWSIHNDDSAGNKLDIRSNNSSKMSLTTEGHLTIGGNVGIGTKNPQAKLEVAGALKLSKAGTLLFHNTNESGNPNGDGFRIRYQNNFFGPDHADALVVEKTDGNNPNPDGGIAFVNTGKDGKVETALVIKGNGNVGIGGTNPTSQLEVRGTIHSSSGGVKFPDGTVQKTAVAIAYGIINKNGTIRLKTSNIESATWNPNLERYEIQLSGGSHLWRTGATHVTVVTPLHYEHLRIFEAVFPETSNEGKKLLVYFYNTSGRTTQPVNGFQFVTFNP